MQFAFENQKRRGNSDCKSELATPKRSTAFRKGVNAPTGGKTSATAEAGGKKWPFHKPLPTQFRHDGFDYRQIARERDAAIYEQSWNGNQTSAAFEVIRIRLREGFEVSCRFVEPAEVYPNSEAWGVNGWTVLTRDAAFEKLRALCQ